MSAGSSGMAQPLISVVMSVYNAADHVRWAVRSILDQAGVELEFIIVNDGSTDDTGKILARYASPDPRVRIVEQPNTGLTKALARGCGLARGKYIARQDADDRSLPGRLRRQCDLLEHSPELALASCFVRFVGPCAEELGTVEPGEAPAETTRLLRQSTVDTIRSIAHHGSAMFPRELYERVGGYRSAFHYVQDLDLWLRLTEHGLATHVKALLYEARIDPTDISSTCHAEQLQLSALSIEAMIIRGRNGDEAAVLTEAAKVRENQGRLSERRLAAGNYFIGRQLLGRRDHRASKYLWSACELCPGYLTAWAALIVAKTLHLQ